MKKLIYTTLALLAATSAFAQPVLETGWTEQTTVAGNPATSLNVAEPSGLSTGDLSIILCTNDDGTDTAQWDDVTNKPTGFTLINHAGSSTSDAHTGAWWREITGGESWPITVTAQSQDDIICWGLRITGADVSDPIDIVGTDYDSGSSTSHGITGVTTTVNDTLVFYVIGADHGGSFPHSVAGAGWGEDDDAQSGTTLTQGSASFGTRTVATAGASGTATVTINISEGASGFLFAIAPAASTTVVPIIDTHNRRRRQ